MGLDVPFSDEDSSIWETENWEKFRQLGYVKGTGLIHEVAPFALRAKSLTVAYWRYKNCAIKTSFEKAKKIKTSQLKRNGTYMADSTLGVVVKNLQREGYDIFKTNYRYYGNIIEQAEELERKILTLDIYFACLFPNVFILADN